MLDDLGAGPTAAEEGLGSDRTIDLPFTYSPGAHQPQSAVTLVTVRGLPEQLSFNTGAKLDNGDWLFIKSDLVDEDGANQDLKIIASDENYSGDFVLSYWTVTSNPLTGETAISEISKAVGTVKPVADSSNLSVVADVAGLEDAGRAGDGRIDTSQSDPIKLNIFYALNDTDGSESAKLQLKIKSSDVIHNANDDSNSENDDASLNLVIRYQQTEQDGKKTIVELSPTEVRDESTNEVVYYLFEIDDLELFDDERVGSQAYSNGGLRHCAR